MPGSLWQIPDPSGQEPALLNSKVARGAPTAEAEAGSCRSGRAGANAGEHAVGDLCVVEGLDVGDAERLVRSTVRAQE